MKNCTKREQKSKISASDYRLVSFHPNYQGFTQDFANFLEY